MKTLFGKWLKFEKVHGTEAQQAEVRQSALDYLNKKDAAVHGQPEPEPMQT